jgi:hypothetical protein
MLPNPDRHPGTVDPSFLEKKFFKICANLHSVVTAVEPEADPREPQLFSLAEPELDLYPNIK